jgi:hypothetical protein
MGGQGSGIFSACMSRSSTSKATSRGWCFPQQAEFYILHIQQIMYGAYKHYQSQAHFQVCYGFGLMGSIEVKMPPLQQKKRV